MNKFRQWFAPKDMTVGVPWKQLASFMIPMLIGNIAQQLYSTTDSIVVGRYVGDNALSAVGSAGPILFLMLALAIGISTGTNILVAQSYGAGDRKKLSLLIGNTLTLTLFLSVALTVIGILIARPLLELLRTPPEIIDWCTDYLRIFFAGIIGFFLYNNLSGILRGLGDSLSALLFLLICTVLNIFLDIWFVASFGLGVAGVALATILAQFISAVLCLVKLRSMRGVFDMNRQLLRPDREIIGEIVRLAVPSSITQIMFSLAMIVVQALTNSFGVMVIACNVIVMRVDGFAMMPNMSFNVTLTTYAGQNLGARKYDRLHQGARQGMVMALSISAVITALILLFSPALIRVFTSTEALISLSVRMLRILSVGYVIMSVTMVLTGIMRGTGEAVIPMLISTATSVVLRVPIAYAIAWFTRSEEWPNGNPMSTFLSLLIAWVLGAVVSLLVYRKTIDRRIRIVEANPMREPDLATVDLYGA